MSKSLVIVESPAKAKTINKYLGKDYTVEASLGHIKDLPKNKIGVELEHGTFEPELIVIPGKEKVVDRLKKLAKSSDAVFLAPDPDREGEAIAAHLEEVLRGVVKKSAIHRVTFNEITPKAVRAAFEHARQVDQNLVDAQQTRRVLDRIVGYQISPLLWDKVRRGLSAGRVQTVALRLIVEREEEIKAFVPVEHWTIDARLSPDASAAEFKARFVGIDGAKSSVETVDTPALPNESETSGILAALDKAAWSVREIEQKERRRNASAPFTTSKLQQDSARQLGFSVKRTMGVAQRLYEGVELGEEGSTGLITYMRTDSTRVSPEAIAEVRRWISEKHGAAYLPASPNAYKSKKDAQDAHEAIRPTSVGRHPDAIKRYLSDEQYRLYRLIWRRFVASQMTPAVYDQTTVEIEARADRRYDFRATGSVLRFDGFLTVYEEGKSFDAKPGADDEMKNQLPALSAGQPLTLRGLDHEQHFTEPKPRFNEASLVRELEERGIGRPSTYATIINTIQEREYVTRIGGGRGAKFVPTEIGSVVTRLLVANFPYIFDLQYTARLEGELDNIEEGQERWTALLGGFYGHFSKEMKQAEKHMENIKRMEKPTDEKCDLCGSPLVLKWGKFGSFYACSAYDKKNPNSCTFTKENLAAKPEADPNAQEAEQGEEYCENCGRVMVLKRGRFGMFMACPGYNEDPPCRTTRRLNQKQQQKPPQPLDEKCPKCGQPLVLRNGPYGEFISCSGYPKCKYIKQNLVEGMKCPKCGTGDIAERKARRGNLFYGCTNYPKCDFTSSFKPVNQKCPECGSTFLVEKTLKSGVYLVCPNNRKTSGEEGAASKRKGKAKSADPNAPVCGYSKKIAEAPPEEVAQSAASVEARRYKTKAEPAVVA